MNTADNDIVKNEETTNYRFFAFNILKAKAEAVFALDKALVCLLRSDSFLSELFNILNGLNTFKITPEKFEEIVKNIDISQTDRKRLLAVSKVYFDYVQIMTQNCFDIPSFFPALFKKNYALASRNAEIKKRIEFLNNEFNTENTQIQKGNKTEDLRYIAFSDVQNEFSFIAEEIKTAVVSGIAKYSDFAVFADKTEARKKLLDLMKALELPVITDVYNEDYENLKRRILDYAKISKICTKLNLQEFRSENLKNLNLSSKAQKEIYLEELDESVKNLLSEILPDSFVTERLYNEKENSSKTFLENVYNSWQKFTEEDKTLLAQEFSAINKFYGFYLKGDFANAVGSVIDRHGSKFNDPDMVKYVYGKKKSLNQLQELYEKMPDTKISFDGFNEIMEWSTEYEDTSKDAIFIGSVAADLKKKNEFKYIYIAGLTENNYPGTNPSYPFISEIANKTLIREIQKSEKDYAYFLTDDEIYFYKKYQSFCAVIALCTEKLTLTTHQYEQKKQVLPSVFFTTLAEIDSQNYEKSSRINEIEKRNFDSVADSNALLKTGVIKNTDVLKLNPSSISTFQKCPKKYYFKNLLNLKEPYSFSASYGSIVHAVFELLNRKFLDDYTKNTALALAEVLFASKNSEEEEQTALRAGFKQTDIELVKASDDLSLTEMKDNFYEAIEDFSLCGGFFEPPKNVDCEKSFTFTLPEIPNVIFDGRIDAIITEKEGTVKVVDYKTGKDKINTLEYLISEPGVNFKLKSGKDPSNVESLQNTFDYQIPLYYLACQNSQELADYKDKTTFSGLVYIRPKYKDNGFKEDFVSAQNLEFYKDKIIQNLKETVVDKIYSETEFKKAPGFSCEMCGYKFLCDAEDDDE